MRARRWRQGPEREEIVAALEDVVARTATGPVQLHHQSWAFARRRFGAPASWTALEHVTVVKQSIKHRTHCRNITEEFSPVFNGTIRRQQRAGAFVASHDDLQQILGCRHRQLAHTEVVDDEQRHGGEPVHKLFACTIGDRFGQIVK
jgi:hypothetical protein